MRFLAGKRVSDRVPIKSLLEKFNTVSVNQLNAQIKLLEIWKSQNIQDYPLELKKHEAQDNVVTTRAVTRGRLLDLGKSTLTQGTCLSDAIKIWNSAPLTITNNISLFVAKKEIKKYVRSLPV